MVNIWRYCRNCSCLWDSGFSNRGVCAADKDGHVHDGSDDYLIDTSCAVNGIDGRWRTCFVCHQFVRLFDKLNGDYVEGSVTGYCPCDRHRHEHGTNGSTVFYIYPSNLATTDMQGCWNECTRCRALYRRGHGGSVCSKGGSHSAGASYSLKIKTAPAPPRQKTPAELAEEQRQREEQERRKREEEEEERRRQQAAREVWEKMTPEEKKKALAEQEEAMSQFKQLSAGMGMPAMGGGGMGMGMPAMGGGGMGMGIPAMGGGGMGMPAMGGGGMGMGMPAMGGGGMGMGMPAMGGGGMGMGMPAMGGGGMGMGMPAMGGGGMGMATGMPGTGGGAFGMSHGAHGGNIMQQQSPFGMHGMMSQPGLPDNTEHAFGDMGAHAAGSRNPQSSAGHGGMNDMFGRFQ